MPRYRLTNSLPMATAKKDALLLWNLTGQASRAGAVSTNRSKIPNIARRERGAKVRDGAVCIPLDGFCYLHTF